MKKLFLLIIILTLNLFGQGWNSIVTTGIIEPVQTDIFTNSSAIHILIQTYDGEIVYYNLNSEGIVCTTKTCTLQTHGSFPNIIGTNDKIFAIYKTVDNNNNVIRVRYSTNNGDSWNYDVEDRQTTANYCNGVDAVYDLGNGVHIVWATQDGGTSGFETYYRRLAPDNSWPEYKNVTDVPSYEYGGNPSVTVSPNRVHVSFNTDATTNNYGLGDVKTRDKYNGNWQTPQTVVSVSSDQYQSMDERLLVRGDYLYLFYSRENPQTYPQDLRFRTRRADDTQGWSGFTQLEEGTLFQEEDAFEITKTTNDYIHIVYKKYVAPYGWSYIYKYYNGENWSDPDNFDHNSVALRQIGLSSVSNDLFCTWVKWETPTKYMRFRQYDDIPLVPQNLAVAAYVVGDVSHPKLTWSLNNEPDVYINENAYEIQRRIRDLPGSWGRWQFISYVNGDVDNYIDTELIIQGSGTPKQAEYKIRAIDLAEHISEWSSTVLIYFGRYNKISTDIQNNDYSLSQNFPNPFNPTTTIEYSIKSPGDVSLKVYDILGTEVASLVNEVKEAGNYSVTFNAANLPSGMYVYILSTSNFIETKKLILLK